MKEFILLFRQADYDYSKASPEELRTLSDKWKRWVNGIAASGNLAGNGSRLFPDGKVIRPGGVVTDGPFVEVREWLGSFIVVKAETLEAAAELGHGCPALDVGGSVEVRQIMKSSPA